MTLTRSFKETVLARIQKDPEFKKELFLEGMNLLLEGDLDTAKVILRDYINATIGFEKLSEKTGTPSKSLMRMLSNAGNPAAKNLFAIISALQKDSGVIISAQIAPQKVAA